MVVTRNGFNELSCLAMVWMVHHHLWQKCNCFLCKTLFLGSGPTIDCFDESGRVAPGQSPFNALYDIGLTYPFSPSVHQPWYANGTALTGLHENNVNCLTALKAVCPWFRYFPEPKKTFTSAWPKKTRLPELPLQQCKDILEALLG